MKRFLIHNKNLIEALLALIQAFALGIYINYFISAYNVNNNFFSAVNSLGNINILLSIIFIIIYSQIKLAHDSSKIFNSEKKVIIEQILKSACLAIIHPHKTKHIRAIITMCNKKKRTRTTKYAYNVNTAPERTAIYDIDFGVTGKSYTKRIPIAEELASNRSYDKNLEGVEPRLKCVLAAPIFRENEVIGILAFDSFETIKSIKFDNDEAKENAQSWADILSSIL